MAIFKGSGVAIITPFHDDGSVNFEVLDEILEDQIAKGTDSIVICGTTGESATMTGEEHVATIAHTIKTVNGRIPVIAGTGSNDTAYAIEMSKEVADLGADGLLCVTPYYNKCTQNGLIKHYTAIAEAVNGCPIIMYNVPSRTGVNITPATAAYLAKNVENIVGIKEASGNIAQVAKMAQLSEGKLDIYSGNDDMIVPLLSVGGLGVISVLANVAPKQTHDMVYHYLEGRAAEATKMQLEALPLIDQLFSEVNPIPVKAAMAMQGWKVGPLHLPLTELEDAHKVTLEKAMREYGVL
ncbi:MAG: 4-hydroxy-tetrahydrodipicolinate synthase [Lachnospiraceae bacterium]|nr:4-hydroxy-tetrahydrodipicolinate synthase [Candidatus Equihabitans merdae]